jgi:flagellar hook-basal body complex protein FliE
MTVDPILISPLAPPVVDRARSSTLAPDAMGQPTFEAMLRGGLAALEHGVGNAQAHVQALALGDAVPTHRVMLALEDARLSLQFALAVRTRLVEAYQDVMRMQL